MRYWKCGPYNLPLGRKTYVMGIVNLSPDSFSGDGTGVEEGLRQALQMVEDGADILDIGGESSRPGALPIANDEELRRVLPLIEELRGRIDVPISIDTTKAQVARRALDAGACIVNDISAGTFDEAMLATVAATEAGCVLMHLRGRPQSMAWSQSTSLPTAHAAGNNPQDAIWEIKQFWAARVQAAKAAGIGPECIAVDPGFGFGKSLEENLALIRCGHELADFGFPMLCGTSRKSTISKLLNDAPVQERLWGTAATVALAIAHGYDIVRVHDVRAMCEVARVADAITREQQAASTP